MSAQTEKPPRIGTEITVRISLTFQEAPDVHTLLAMTPVRERGKLVRLALERYIAETGHPAGDVEQQIQAISTWLRCRATSTEQIPDAAKPPEVTRTIVTEGTRQFRDVQSSMPARTHPAPAGAIDGNDAAPDALDASSASIKRWLQT
jgi:hypothetical protein